MKSAFLIAWLALAGEASEAATAPHVIFVMADDMGWGQTGYRGHEVLKTPNLDAMAANGLRFERFYAGGPVCSPTRASVLTGRSPDRTGVLSAGYALRRQEKTIAQALKKAGYATGHFGKWHLDGYKGPGAPVLADDPNSPGAFGFDHWISATNFIDRDPWLGRNGAPEKLEGDSSEVIVNEALHFIDQQHAAKKPFFAVIWYGTPHAPFRASDADKAPFQNLSATSADHHGELVAMDRSLGALRQHLRNLGIADNTLLVFCSDNGGLREIEPDATGGLRGHKGLVYEGGLRVPAVMEWPTVIKPRITTHPAAVMDLFPTVADIAGLPEASFVQPLDGVSLKPLLTAEIGERSQAIPFRYGSKGALVDNQYKLVSNDLKAGPFELYDLAADPSESNDISTKHPQILERMKKELLAFDASVDASFAGKDYPGGEVSPADPEPAFWYESERYQSFLKESKNYWAYKSYMERTAKAGKRGGKKKLTKAR